MLGTEEVFQKWLILQETPAPFSKKDSLSSDSDPALTNPKITWLISLASTLSTTWLGGVLCSLFCPHFDIPCLIVSLDKSICNLKLHWTYMASFIMMRLKYFVDIMSCGRKRWWLKEGPLLKYVWDAAAYLVPSWRFVLHVNILWEALQ